MVEEKKVETMANGFVSLSSKDQLKAGGALGILVAIMVVFMQGSDAKIENVSNALDELKVGQTVLMTKMEAVEKLADNRYTSIDADKDWHNQNLLDQKQDEAILRLEKLIREK